MRRGAPARRPSGERASGGALPPTPSRSTSRSTKEQAATVAWVRILAVHKRGLAAIREHLEREMTLPRFDLLSNLAQKDGQTLTSLARGMLVTAGNLTGLVDRAARDGMVERVADPNDRRAWRVHLTPRGQRAFRDAERRHAGRIMKLFEGFTPTEVATLTRLLDKLRAELRAPETDDIRPRASRKLPPTGGPSTRRKARKKTPE